MRHATPPFSATPTPAPRRMRAGFLRAASACVLLAAGALTGCAGDTTATTSILPPRGMDTERPMPTIPDPVPRDEAQTQAPPDSPDAPDSPDSPDSPDPARALSPVVRVKQAFGSRFPPDTMLVGGEPIRTGTRIVLFTEQRGYNAYAGPRHFGSRTEKFYNGQPDMPQPLAAHHTARGFTRTELQDVVDRFVIHYDACGCSKRCFDVLRDRGLSVHFMLDIDGTIYQTMDLQERAWHASESNSRSIGVEIANIGAYPPGPGKPNPFAKWYTASGGRTRLIVPPDANLLRPAAARFPAREQPVEGAIHGRAYTQYDLTDAQYDALVKLTAALCRTFPEIKPDAPRGAGGRVTTGVMNDVQLQRFGGLVGHYHLTTDKQDPGPAFDWERLIRGTRRELAR